MIVTDEAPEMFKNGDDDEQKSDTELNWTHPSLVTAAVTPVSNIREGTNVVFVPSYL